MYTITRAFEAGAFTKAVAGLGNPDLIYRRKALLARKQPTIRITVPAAFFCVLCLFTARSVEWKVLRA